MGLGSRRHTRKGGELYGPELDMDGKTCCCNLERLESAMKNRGALNPRTIERARQKAREGKAPSTQAGEFVREEIKHIREGKHGVKSKKQAIAIGLSKARQAGIPRPPPHGKKAPQVTQTDRPQNLPSSQRSHAVLKVLRR